MEDANPNFRALTHAATQMSDLQRLQAQCKERPTTALHMAASMPAISATDRRDVKTHRGLVVHRCYVQEMEQNGSFTLQLAAPPPMLRTQGWTDKLSEAGITPVAGLMFSLLTEDIIISIGAAWDGAHIADMRCIQVLAPEAAAALKARIAGLMPSEPEPEADPAKTDDENEKAKAVWMMDTAVAHAFRMVSAMYFYMETVRAPAPDTTMFLYAIRDVEDVDFIMEMLAERVIPDLLDPRVWRPLQNSWRQLVSLLQTLNQLHDMLAPDSDVARCGTDREIVDMAADVIECVKSVVRHNVRKAYVPGYPNYRWGIGDEEAWRRNAEGFVGCRPFDNLTKDFEEEDARLQRAERRAAPATPEAPRRAGRGRSRRDDDDYDSEDGCGGHGAGGATLSVEDRHRLSTALRSGQFQDWRKPGDLAIIAKATHSAVGSCDPLLPKLTDKMTSTRKGAPTEVLTMADKLARDLAEREEIWDIPLGMLLKISHGLMSARRHNFNLLTLAVATSKNRTDTSGMLEKPSVWFRRDQVNMATLSSMFFMLRRLVVRGLMPAVYMSKDDVHEMWNEVQHLHFHYGKAFPPEELFGIVERTFSDHVDEILDLADARAAAKDETDVYPSIMERVARWQADNPVIFNRAIVGRTNQLEAERGTQAGKKEPLRMDPAWLGKLPMSAESLANAEKKKRAADQAQGRSVRQRGGNAGAGGARPAPLADATNTYAVTCFACLGPHRSDDPLCPCKPGSGVPWNMGSQAHLPAHVRKQIARWRANPVIIAKYAVPPVVVGGLRARSQNE